MIPEGVRRYLRHGLSATPIVVDHLFKDITEKELDYRPDPDRFTLREAIAHMADWEGVWLGRMDRMRLEQDPFLPAFDESQWAIDHDYAHADVTEQLTKFRSGREDLSNFLSQLTDDQWSRIGYREDVGEIMLYDLAVLVLGHDGYHLRQIVEFRGAYVG